MLILTVFNRSLSKCLKQHRARFGIQILSVKDIISRSSDTTTTELLINLYERTQHVAGSDTKIFRGEFFHTY